MLRRYMARIAWISISFVWLWAGGFVLAGQSDMGNKPALRWAADAEGEAPYIF